MASSSFNPAAAVRLLCFQQYSDLQTFSLGFGFGAVEVFLAVGLGFYCWGFFGAGIFFF